MCARAHLLLFFSPGVALDEVFLATHENTSRERFGSNASSPHLGFFPSGRQCIISLRCLPLAVAHGERALSISRRSPSSANPSCVQVHHATRMLNERAQIVLSVQPLNGEEDRRLVTDALLRLEGVRTAHVDVPRGVVRVDGAASDVELLATMEALGKRAAVVTHTRGVKAPPSSSSTAVKMQLFMKLLGRQVRTRASMRTRAWQTSGAAAPRLRPTLRRRIRVSASLTLIPLRAAHRRIAAANQCAFEREAGRGHHGIRCVHLMSLLCARGHAHRKEAFRCCWRRAASTWGCGSVRSCVQSLRPRDGR